MLADAQRGSRPGILADQMRRRLAGAQQPLDLDLPAPEDALLIFVAQAVPVVEDRLLFYPAGDRRVALVAGAAVAIEGCLRMAPASRPAGPEWPGPPSAASRAASASAALARRARSWFAPQARASGRPNAGEPTRARTRRRPDHRMKTAYRAISSHRWAHASDKTAIPCTSDVGQMLRRRRQSSSIAVLPPRQSGSGSPRRQEMAAERWHPTTNDKMPSAPFPG